MAALTINNLFVYLQVEIPSDDEDDEVITITDDTYKPISLEKMITLIASLVEKSRGEDKQLHISDKDYNAIIGGKVSIQGYLHILSM